MYLATARVPADVETRLQDRVVATFPNVTAIPLRSVLERVSEVLAQISFAVRFMAAFSIAAGLVVMAGALAATRYQRLYESVILKTLGATRLRLLAAYAIEYLLIGTATAVFGVVGGSLAAWLIVAQLMHLSFTWLPEPALVAALAAVAVTVTLGLAGTYVALGQKAAPILRNL